MTAPTSRLRIGERRLAEKAALRGLLDAVSDVRIKRLLLALPSVRNRSMLYIMADDERTNRPKAWRLRALADAAEGLAHKILAAVTEARRVADESEAEERDPDAPAPPRLAA